MGWNRHREKTTRSRVANRDPLPATVGHAIARGEQAFPIGKQMTLPDVVRERQGCCERFCFMWHLNFYDEHEPYQFGFPVRVRHRAA